MMFGAGGGGGGGGGAVKITFVIGKALKALVLRRYSIGRAATGAGAGFTAGSAALIERIANIGDRITPG